MRNDRARNPLKRLAALLLVLFLLCGLCGCGTGPDSPEPAPEPDPPSPPAPDTDPVKKMIEGMTVEQKLAQMMIVALRSDPGNTKAPLALTDACREIIGKYCFGGVILFSPNFSDIPQTVKLIRDIQEAAAVSEAGIPMFVGTDQEGGQISRLPYASSGPGNMALAAAGDLSLTREAGRIIGSELAALGFNMDFAPVCDVNSEPENPVIGIRSFSDDPDTVSAHAAAFAAGLQDSGVCAVVKHFPGHGNVKEDSHTGLPLSDLTLKELENADLLPFAACAAEADAVMTAHIRFPALETETYVSKKDGKEVTLPATLSRTVITGLLREKMGYDGVVMTDSMVMGAITDHFDRIDAAVLAINAGADILLCPMDLYKDSRTDTLPRAEAYMQALAKRVRSGEISEARLDESVARILKLKLEKGILEPPSLSLEEQTEKAGETVGCPEHRTAEWEMALKAVTLLKNEAGTLPLDGNSGRFVVLVPNSYRIPTAEYCSRRLMKEGLLAQELTVVNYSGLKADSGSLRKKIEGASAVIILSQSASRNRELVKLIGILDGMDVPSVLISIGLPYDAAHYNEADALLCAYQPYGAGYDARGDGPFGLNAAAALCAVFGRTAPSGRLPVDVPLTGADGSFLDGCLYPRGYGLTDWGI